MGEVLDFLAEKEILILCSIVALLSFVLVILFIQESYMKARKKSKLKQNTQELKNLTQEVGEEMKKQKNVSSTSPIMSNIKEVEIKKEEPQKSVVEQETVVQPPKETKVALDSFSPIGPMPSIQTPSSSTPLEPVRVNEKKQEEVKPSPQQIVYKDEVYTKKEAQEELKRITEELEKEEKEKIELTEFEAKQEENAIISLEELLEKGRKLVLENEQIQYQDEGNEPISLQDLERKVQQKEAEPSAITPQENVVNQEPHLKKEEPVKPKVVLQDLKTASLSSTTGYQGQKYTPTPVISPVFGIEESNSSTSYHDEALRLENTANFEKLDDEIRKTNEFLTLLKELEKKLD